MPILKINNLRVYYNTLRGKVRAVDNISLSLEKGEILGLAGESGCGKTTTALTIMKVLPPEAIIESGEILFNNVDLVKLSEKEIKKIRWRKISMIFQNAMNALNPVRNVGSQIVDAMVTHLNITEEQAWEKVKKLFELVGLDPSRVKDYPHEFSGGMRQRVFIAMALSCDPEIVIADEPTTGLDVVVQRKILNLLRNLRNKLNLSIILITHDLSVIAETCDKVAIMYGGKIVEYGSVYEIFENPLHPYTYLLIKAFPRIGLKRERLATIPGSPPSLINPPSGCRFHPRCPFANEKCRNSEPEVKFISRDRFVACHYVGKLNLVI